VSARRLSFRVIEGSGKPRQPRPDDFTPAHGYAIACVAGAIVCLGLAAAVLAWWERP
jgi:hypothetical protein